MDGTETMTNAPSRGPNPMTSPWLLNGAQLILRTAREPLAVGAGLWLGLKMLMLACTANNVAHWGAHAGVSTATLNAAMHIAYAATMVGTITAVGIVAATCVSRLIVVLEGFTYAMHWQQVEESVVRTVSRLATFTVTLFAGFEWLEHLAGVATALMGTH